MRRNFAVGSGGLGALREWEEATSASGGSAGRGAERRDVRFGGGGSFRSSSRNYRRRSCIHGSTGVRLFFDAHQILIGDFPAEMLVLAALLEILFEEDGAAGIGDKRARSGQKDIAGAILHLNPAPEKGGVASHPVLSVDAR